MSSVELAEDGVDIRSHRRDAEVDDEEDEQLESGCNWDREKRRGLPQWLWKSSSLLATSYSRCGAERVARRRLVLCILLGVQMSLESGIGRRAPWITTCSSVSVWSHLAGLRIEISIQGRFALLYGVLLRLWRVR